jgi:uncharacterized protein (DUF1330 family)
MEYITPDQAALEEFLAQYPADKPVVMLNLLKFLPEAAYQPGEDALPCSGAEAYARYGQVVIPLVKACGGSSVWQGRPAAMLIGPQDKDWHLAALIRYPRVQAFLDMVSSPEYQAVSFHRTAALADSRLIAHEEL